MFTKLPSWGLLVLGLALSNAFADTTEVKTQTIVEVKKKRRPLRARPKLL